MRKFLGASTEAGGFDGVTNTDLIVRLKTRGQYGFLQRHIGSIFSSVGGISSIGSILFNLGIIGSSR